jgi:hypothetical protein
VFIETPTRIALDFYPKNEGEQANYIFTVTLNTTTLLDSYMFFLRFPADYDPNLSLYSLKIESLSLQGALKYKLRNREVFIYGNLNVKPFADST